LDWADEDDDLLEDGEIVLDAQPSVEPQTEPSVSPPAGGNLWVRSSLSTGNLVEERVATGWQIEVENQHSAGDTQGEADEALAAPSATPLSSPVPPLSSPDGASVTMDLEVSTVPDAGLKPADEGGRWRGRLRRARSTAVVDELEGLDGGAEALKPDQLA